jgi:hypothetical protein
MTQSHSNGQSYEQLLARNDWFVNRLACVPNSKLDWISKGIVLGISQEFIRLGIPHDELTMIWYGNVSDHSGLPTKTISNGVGHLVKAKALITETKWVSDKVTKEKKRRTLIAFTREFISNPGALFEEQEKINKRGQGVRRHKGCGGEVVNLCTQCGQSHIPETEIYYADDPDEKEDAPRDGKEMLAQLDNLIDIMAPYYDAADIDDDVTDALGGAAQALTASPGEIAQRMAVPRHVREGLDDEDLEIVLDTMHEMKGGQ